MYLLNAYHLAFKISTEIYNAMTNLSTTHIVHEYTKEMHNST